MAWTEQMVEDLKKMWDEGLTTGEIGKRLNVSKNSIVGKVHRLQLPARPSPIKKKDSGEDTAEIPAAKTAKAEPAPKEKEHKTVAPAPKPAAEPDPEALRERIETIRNSVHVEHPKGKHKTMLTDLPLADRRPQRRKLSFLRPQNQNRADLLRRTRRCCLC